MHTSDPDPRPCPDDNSIDGYLSGELPDQQRAALEDHLDACASCRGLVAALVLDVTAHDSEYRLGDPLLAGTLIEHFQVMRLLGRGAMGEVYLCRDTKLGRRVALKVVSPEVLGSEEAINSFLSEARITGRFNHPHIVTIHAANIWRGLPYLALEYLDGETLRQRMDRERLSPRETMRVGLAIADALREAHDHKVLHRDLKPANVLLPRDGRLRVVDFGLSRRLVVDQDEEGQAAALPSHDGSAPGVGGGTPTYMSPEQWEARAPSEAADVWALGVILHELISGRPPYRARSLTEQRRMVTAARPVARLEAPSLPQGVVDLVSGCLAKDPRERPSAAGVHAVLEQLLARHGGATAQAAQEAQNPFRGLLPFTEQHADLFFGRDAEIELFLERARLQGVLPVVGPSGVGKTSFVQAGVVPRLRDQASWLVLRVRPGAKPFASLAHRLATVEGAPWAARAGQPPEGQPALAHQEELELARHLAAAPMHLNLALRELARGQGCRVLLFVDQLEELCTLVSNRLQQTAFIEAICGAGDDPDDPVRVIFTLRDDFLGRLAAGPRTRESLGRLTLLGCPDVAAQQEIVTRPVTRRGYSYDQPQMPRRMVEAVRGEPSALPLLQFATQRLWERRDRERRLLLESVYEEIGGVAGALARHADSILEGLSAADVRLVRQLLLRLVTPEGTRRAVARSALLRGLPVRAGGLLDRLVRGRLLTVRRSAGLGDDAAEQGPEEAHLELVHESLVRTWTQLTRWVDEDREDLTFIDQVSQAAELWRKRGHQPEEVWRGKGLHEARRALENLHDRVPELAHRFIKIGLRRQRRRRLRARVLVAAGMALLLVVALVLAHKEREARQQRDRAEAHSKRAVTRQAQALREGAGAAMVRGDMLEARARLRSSLESLDSTAGRALWWQVRQDPQVWRKRLAALPYDVALSPDGKQVAVASQDRSVYLFDNETLQTSRVLRGHQDQVFTVAFAPDGRRLATGSWSGSVFLWDLQDARQRPPRRLKGHTSAVQRLAFSPDGEVLASASWDKTVRLWAPATGAARGTLKGHERSVMGLAFGPRGERLASCSMDYTTRIWRLPAGSLERTLRGHTGGVYEVAFGKGGRELLSASRDSTIRGWDVASGRQTRMFAGHTSHVYGLDISPGGRLLASTGRDLTIRLWELGSGRTLRVLTGHSVMPTRVKFAPRGRSLYSVARDKTVRRWNPRAGGQADRLVGHAGQVNGVCFSPNGKLLATGGADRTLRLWSVATGAQLAVLRGHTAAVGEVRFSPDGRLIYSAGHDNTIRQWSASTLSEEKVMVGHEGAVLVLSLSRDGARLASAGHDTTIRLWDTRDGTQTRVLRGHTSLVYGVQFSPDGRSLVSTGSDGIVALWELKTGSMVPLAKQRDRVRSAVFSPDGRRLAWGGHDGILRLMDLQTRSLRVVARVGTRIHQLDFHPDGRRLGVPAADGVGRILDLSGNKSRRLEGHAAEVNVVRFSPDGKLAASTSDDGTVRLWDPASGRPRWNAPLLLGALPELCSHRGCVRLGGAAAGQQAPRTGWRTATRARARRAAADPGGVLCLQTHDGRLELWDRQRDARLVRLSMPAVRQVVALPGGCLVLDGASARVVSRSGATRTLRADASAVAWSGGRVLVASAGRVELMDAAGAVSAAHPSGAGVTALALGGQVLAAGFNDGSIELRRVGPTRGRALPAMQGVPSSPVVRLMWGPSRTLFAGFANGTFGIWSLDSGVRLYQGRLHGAVVHAALASARLHVATALGHHTVLNLSVLQQGYCELLREVWSQVPVTWDRGRPVVRAPPAKHRCNKR